jgi:hypothetical protein
MDTSDELLQILQNIEDEQASKKVAETISYLNKPEKIAISSNNAEQEPNGYNPYTGNGFASFTVNLPRGALGVKSVELLNANIPQAQASIPDECLIFYYYRLKTQTDYQNTETILLEQPSINNLYYIRLLPSYYKKEFIVYTNSYGYNRTFNSYQDLASELLKACGNDLLYDNYSPVPLIPLPYFIPNDISITFNEEFNKFQMTGNNAFTSWASAWDAETSYHINDIVSYNGINYICIQNNDGVQPPNVATWEIYTSPFYTYLSAGYEDPNILTLANILQPLFKEWDFNYFQHTDSLLNVIASIPPQPIVQYQTLNLRLGFTFNGIFTYNNNMLVGVENTGNNILISFYNRLRPIPIYIPVNLLGATNTIYNIAGTPYEDPTYTADSYANLCYSSIVNIYCSFIGPSTTDTQRNTNLLSIVPFNAGNLGITFYEPKISNKLTKISKDIYSMFFEFRREDGELYYFPNSAIITLQLALSYE